MNRATSTYLDLVRLLAAVMLLVTHLAYPRYTGGLLLELGAAIPFLIRATHECHS